MTPRERFITALERRPPTGRVPHFELVFFLTMEALGSYHGTAWHVVDFVVPEKVTGKLWLLFGAIDGDSWLWINGKPAGSGASPSVAWDKPFGLDVTNLAIKGQRNRLVVKVHKDLYAAGIWKPVKLMEVKHTP